MKPHIGIAGAGFSGAVLARELAESGRYRISVFDERNHVAGLCHTERDEETGIMIHKHGPRIFYTNREDIWNYVNQWGRFQTYINRTKAITKEGVFPIPINLLTINHFFKKKLGPKEARDFLGSLGDESIGVPQNYAEVMLKHIGPKIYDTFFKEYLVKLWGRGPTDLPVGFSKDPEVRLNYDDKSYNHVFQGIPINGYTEIVRRILDHQDIELRLGQRCDPERKKDYDHLFWSGPIDGYFRYQLGSLGYRALKFERFVEQGDHQGNAIIKFCDEGVPFTRIIEHKHLAPWEEHEKTVCYKEYIGPCEENDDPYIPMGLDEDRNMLKQYFRLAQEEKGITFIGRLGTYRHLEMEEAIGQSLALARHCLSTELHKWPVLRDAT